MSQEIQEAVYKQQEVIKDKQLRVKQDLDQVEPAVIEAQNGTSSLRPPARSLLLSLLLTLNCLNSSPCLVDLLFRKYSLPSVHTSVTLLIWETCSRCLVARQVSLYIMQISELINSTITESMMQTSSDMNVKHLYRGVKFSPHLRVSIFSVTSADMKCVKATAAVYVSVFFCFCSLCDC